MNQLTELQLDFQSYLLAAGKHSAFHGRIIDDAKVGAERRLGIYYDAYRLRLIEALSNGYPKLHLLLGGDLFDSTARSYIDAYPSPYRNLRWFGDAMAEHLLDRLPQHPIAAEMADFEWNLALAFDAEDTPVLQLADLAAIPPEDWAEVSFVFQPSIKPLPLRWNTVAVWKALDAEETPPVPEQQSSFETWLIWRHELTPRFRSIEAMEEIALNAAIGGATFGDICETLGMQLEKAQALEYDAQEEATVKAAQYLASWLESGMIAGFINQ